MYIKNVTPSEEQKSIEIGCLREMISDLERSGILHLSDTLALQRKCHLTQIDAIVCGWTEQDVEREYSEAAQEGDKATQEEYEAAIAAARWASGEYTETTWND